MKVYDSDKIINSAQEMVMTLTEEFHQKENSSQQQHHPDLDDLYFIDRLNNDTRIHPNGNPIDIENDIFSGQLLLMVRTSDADVKIAPEYTGGTPSNDKVSNYFRPKKRRFEFQFQLKFKQKPTSDSELFLSFEYDEPVELGIIARSLFAAAVKFTKIPNFSVVLSGKEHVSDEEMEEGLYENPHFAFPVDRTLDVITVTKPGEELPELGGAIKEDKEALAYRRKNGIEFNTEDTYTFCLYTTYVDFASWKAVNIPAVPRFSLANISGAQPVSLRLYFLDMKENDGKHLQKYMTDIFNVEFSRRGITTFGNGAKEWMQKSFHARDSHTRDSTDGESDDDDDLSYASFFTTFSTAEYTLCSEAEDAVIEKKKEKKIACFC